NEPDFGVLLDDMQYRTGGIIAIDSLLQPRVEAEVAFRLRDDLTDANLTYEEARAAIATASAALEIVDSRVVDWDISIADTVADNASSGAFVLGAVEHPIVGLDTAAVEMAMQMNGVVVSTGTGM
ncbi:fumarylacetoacetate hydrolase family protein, partial [uncultured Arthrobacter sp.]